MPMKPPGSVKLGVLSKCVYVCCSKLAQDNRMDSPIPILPLPTPDAETERLIKMKDEEVSPEYDHADYKPD